MKFERIENVSDKLGPGVSSVLPLENRGETLVAGTSVSRMQGLFENAASISLEAGDDAEEALWIPHLAFDHDKILKVGLSFWDLDYEDRHKHEDGHIRSIHLDRHAGDAQ